MKYLVIEQERYSLYCRIREFDTAEELERHVMQTGIKDVILAQRIGLEINVCNWNKPVESA